MAHDATLHAEKSQQALGCSAKVSSLVAVNALTRSHSLLAGFAHSASFLQDSPSSKSLALGARNSDSKGLGLQMSQKHPFSLCLQEGALQISKVSFNFLISLEYVLI